MEEFEPLNKKETSIKLSLKWERLFTLIQKRNDDNLYQDRMERNETIQNTF